MRIPAIYSAPLASVWETQFFRRYLTRLLKLVRAGWVEASRTVADGFPGNVSACAYELLLVVGRADAEDHDGY